MIQHYILIGKPIPKPRPRMCRSRGLTILADKDPHKADDRNYLERQHHERGYSMFQPSELWMYIKVIVPFPSAWSKKSKLKSVNRLVPTRPDLDNYVKRVMDLLNGLAYPDDNLIGHIVARKCYPSVLDDEGAIYITVSDEPLALGPNLETDCTHVL